LNEANDVANPMDTAYRRFLAAGEPVLSGRPWLVTERRSVGFGELHERIRHMAGWLSAQGIAVGDRVVVSSRDDAEVSLLFVSLVCCGATVVNLDPDTSPARAASLLRRAQPRLLLLDAEIAARWSAPGLPGTLVEIVAAPESGAGLIGRLFGKPAPLLGLHARLMEAVPVSPPASLPAETLAYILFTSGTTEQPKGVCISHRALFAHLDTLSRRFGYDASSRILNTLMLSHTDGMTQGPMIAFHNGIPVFRPFRFEVTRIEALLDAIYRLRITHMVAVPTMLSLMARLGLEQRDAFQGGDFRLLVSCAAQLEKGLWERFQSLFRVPLVNVYGLTETVTGGLFAGPDPDTGVPGSIGRPMDCEVRIVDPDGRDVAPGEAGELLVRGDLLMSGYFGDPELTASTLRDGWLRTGDLARHADGLYWIIGRAKNIIIRGGYNISPEEVAEVLQRHPGVREAVALGVPDPVWGEVVAALVAVDPPVDEDVLRTHCAGHLEAWKVPARFRIVEELPRGRSGKVLLEEARAMLEGAEAPAAGGRKPAPDDIADRLLAVAAACFKSDPGQLHLHATPREVPGWDSLAHMELVAALEKEFGVRFKARDIMALDRLDKALAMIAG
jgi:long-chain acyl-CoA synthetase